MTKITITGYSDDNIEIEGDIREEWGWYPSDGETKLIAVSDGTLLRAEYDSDGIWRFTAVFKGTAEYSKAEGSVGEDTNDVVMLEGDGIKWVAFDDMIAKLPDGSPF